MNGTVAACRASVLGYITITCYRSSSIIIDESLTIFLLSTSIYDDVYIIVDVCAEEIKKSARKYILRIYKF